MSKLTIHETASVPGDLANELFAAEWPCDVTLSAFDDDPTCIAFEVVDGVYKKRIVVERDVFATQTGTVIAGDISAMIKRWQHKIERQKADAAIARFGEFVK